MIKILPTWNSTRRRPTFNPAIATLRTTSYWPDDLSPCSGWVACTRHHTSRDYVTRGSRFTVCMSGMELDGGCCAWQFL